MSEENIKKYRNEIIAWANGEKIQAKNAHSVDWYDVPNPDWSNNSMEFRVKPKETSRLVGVSLVGDRLEFTNRFFNLDLRFEDGKLIGAKVIPVVKNENDDGTVFKTSFSKSNKSVSDMINKMKKSIFDLNDDEWGALRRKIEERFGPSL